MKHREDEFCSSCPQKHGCKQVYEQLGRSDAPSVLVKVLAALVWPLVVFVAALAAAENAARQMGIGEVFGAVAALAAAAAAGFLAMLAGRRLVSRFGQQGKV